MLPFRRGSQFPFSVALKRKIRKPPVYHQAASYVGIALKHTQFDCNTIISTACGCVKQILSTTFGGIRGVAALGGGWKACEERGLAKKKGCHLQSLWDYFFEEPKNGGLFAFLQQKLWDLVYQQSSSYTKRAGHRAWRPALFFAYITLFAFAGIIPFQNLCVFTQDAHVEFLVSIPVIKGKRPKDSLCLVICT